MDYVTLKQFLITGLSKQLFGPIFTTVQGLA